MFSPQRSLRVAMLLALFASLAGLVGGAADSLAILTTATFVSTLSYAALPLAQAVAVRGCTSSADAAGRLGLLSAVDALASTVGVQATLSALSTSRWANGGPPAMLMCAAASAVAYSGLRTLGSMGTDAGLAYWTGVEDTCRDRLASVLAPIHGLDGISGSGGGSGGGGSGGLQAALRVVGNLPVSLSVALLATAVAVPAALLQHGIEGLSTAPSVLDKGVDAVLRLTVQGLLVSHLANVQALGAKGAALIGCLIMAAGSLANVVLSAAGGSEAGAFHLMTAGLYASETAATTLVALAAALSTTPVARRALALVVLHTGITLGPALLPLVGWLVGNGARGRWVQIALLPTLLLVLVPALRQDQARAEASGSGRSSSTSTTTSSTTSMLAAEAGLAPARLGSVRVVGGAHMRRLPRPLKAIYSA